MLSTRTLNDTGAPDIRTLADGLDGLVILPGDPDYDATRALWNGALDKRPALIVRCFNANDVSAAVSFARAEGLSVAVRSGGHSIAGHSMGDGVVVIDLTPMKGIEIDPDRCVARIEPGLTWGEVAVAAERYGLAITSGDTASVGVGGLTLGGGIGWMVRKYGLAIDNVREVELVTADGRFLRANADENAELFWGLRGGGGNFGIATAFEFNLHPVGTVLGGAVFYDARDTATVEGILRSYVRLAAAAPDGLSTQALLMTAPPAPFIPPDWQGRPVVAIAMCFTGDLTEGERVVAPLRELGTTVADVVAPMPYSGIYALTGAAEVPGLRHRVRSLYLEALDGDALHALVDTAAATMSPETLVQVRVLGGAMGRVPVDATAFAHRDKPLIVMVTNFGPEAAGDARRQENTERVWQALRPYAAGVYVNFLGDEGDDRVREAYPPATYARLAALKGQYDPENIFHGNQNIHPAR